MFGRAFWAELVKWAEIFLKWIFTLPTLLMAFPALYQCTLALYRFGLFMQDGCRPGMNHSDDLPEIYALNQWVIPICVVGILSLWQHRKPMRIALITIIAANILGCLAFVVMHKTKALVTYDEYVQPQNYQQ